MGAVLLFVINKNNGYIFALVLWGYFWEQCHDRIFQGVSGFWLCHHRPRVVDGCSVIFYDQAPSQEAWY